MGSRPQGAGLAEGHACWFPHLRMWEIKNFLNLETYKSSCDDGGDGDLEVTARWRAAMDCCRGSARPRTHPWGLSAFCSINQLLPPLCAPWEQSQQSPQELMLTSPGPDSPPPHQPGGYPPRPLA